MKTMRDLIERNERLFGGCTAYVFQDQTRTYRAHGERLRRLAHALRRRGARKGDRVAILSMNSIEYCEVFGACEWSGLIACTVNFRLSAREVLAILKDATPAIFIYERQYDSLVGSIRAELPEELQLIAYGAGSSASAESYESLFEAGEDDSPIPAPEADDLVYLIYTSGTTGRPKGVLSTHKRALRLAEIMAGEMDMGAASRALLPTPLFHVGALNIKNAQRWRHGTNIILRTSEASDIASAIHEHRANTMFLVPIQLQRLLDVADSGKYDLTSINTINMAGAPIPVPLLRRGLERLGQVFVVQYGLTEAQCTTLYKHELAAEAIAPTGRLGSIGHVQPQSQIAIHDEDGVPAPVGTVGEICFRGPSVMDGYWNNTAATLEAFRGGWLRTGDVGYMDDADYVFLVDRRKDVIISGGENIYSREVEEVLHANDLIQEAAVIGVPDAKWGESVTAFVVLKPGAAATEEMIRATARASIAGYKCPKRVIFVADLPRLVTGKVNKNFLRDSWQHSQPGEEARS
ncbi:MAG: hypothetical protein JWO52_7510 [Gammaproteobacteria bacterium]|nr:hypothetical protein [Gammaproteobacteria bacterium]